MLRALYEPFGVSWIDGLDGFASISANYCLINRKSAIMSQVQ